MMTRSIVLLAGVLVAVTAGCSSSGSHPAALPAATTTTVATSTTTAPITTPTSTTTTVASTPQSTGCLAADGRNQESGVHTAWIQMVSASVGYAVLGHRIVGTLDGRHWNQLYVAAETLSYVDAVDARHVWVLGTRSTFATSDGGRNWSVSPKSAVPLTTVHFISADRGWAVSNATLLQTTTGGRVWDAVPAPCPVDRACFADTQHGWLATHTAVYTTSDGGSQWKLVFTVRDPVIAQAGVASDLQCTSGNDAWVLFDGHNCGAGSCAYVEYHCGATSGCVPFTGPGASPGPFSAIDDHTAVFVGFSGPLENPMSMMLVQNDGRSRGAALVVPDGAPQQASPQAVSFTNQARGWIVDGAITESHILATTDGGHTWTVQYRASQP